VRIECELICWFVSHAPLLVRVSCTCWFVSHVCCVRIESELTCWFVSHAPESRCFNTNPPTIFGNRSIVSHGLTLYFAGDFSTVDDVPTRIARCCMRDNLVFYVVCKIGTDFDRSWRPLTLAWQGEWRQSRAAAVLTGPKFDRRKGLGLGNGR
jgi:hypothetical protein